MGKKLTLEQAAEEIGISKRTVRRMISTGHIPALRIGTGNIVRVDSDDLEAAFKPLVPQSIKDGYAEPVKPPANLPRRKTVQRTKSRRPA